MQKSLLRSLFVGCALIVGACLVHAGDNQGRSALGDLQLTVGQREMPAVPSVTPMPVKNKKSRYKVKTAACTMSMTYTEETYKLVIVRLWKPFP